MQGQRFGFGIMAGAGYDALIMHGAEPAKRLLGPMAYFSAALSNPLPQTARFAIELDGETIEDDFSLVSVCNGRYYGGGFMPVAEARMDDGVLNTLVVKKVSRGTFIKFVGPYSKGQYYKFPHVARCVAPKVVRIRSEKPDIVTCLDGDVTIRLSDKRLNFFGPAGCDCNRTARDI